MRPIVIDYGSFEEQVRAALNVQCPLEVNWDPARPAPGAIKARGLLCQGTRLRVEVSTRLDGSKIVPTRVKVAIDRVPRGTWYGWVHKDRGARQPLWDTRVADSVEHSFPLAETLRSDQLYAAFIAAAAKFLPTRSAAELPEPFASAPWEDRRFAWC